ncbi:restriction endonuclease subunit S [Leyella stercorea]
MKKYENYKDSGLEWLGIVPEHWEIFPFKRGVSINNGRDYKHVQSEDGYPVIGSGGQFAFASDYLYDGEVILLGRKGTIDKPRYFNGKFWTVDTMFYAIPNQKCIAKYMYYQALTIPFSLYSTDTALPSMTQTDLGNHLMCFPPTFEQRTIASYLDQKVGQIDALISEKEKMVEDLKAYRSSLITETVTKGLNKEVKMKDSGLEWLGMVPEHWEILPFKRGVSINNGRDYKHVQSEDGYPVIGSGGQFAFASDYLYDGEVILLGRKGTIDKPRYFNGRFWTVDTMFYAIPNQKCIAKYMYYQVLTIPFSLYSTDTALPSMTQTDLGNHLMCFPPTSEQRTIASYLDYKVDQIDALISELEHQLSDLKSYKSSLITEAVTGKIDLRDWQTKQS